MNTEGVVNIYNTILLIHKKNEVMSFAAKWMDLEIVILSEVSQTEKNKYHGVTYMWNLKKKKVQINLSANRNRVIDVETKLTVTMG